MCEIAIKKVRILSIFLTFYAPESTKNRNDEKYNILNFALQIVKKTSFFTTFLTKKIIFWSARYKKKVDIFQI